jgi:hypothetical protein
VAFSAQQYAIWQINSKQQAFAEFEVMNNFLLPVSWMPL